MSYRSWETLLSRLGPRSPLPRRLDASVWKELLFSGSTESALKNALVFLGLCSPEYRPTNALERLVTAPDEERRTILAGLIRQHYGPVLEGIDLSRTTRGELREAFTRAGSKGETADKAISFFVSLTRTAGVPLHDQLKTRKPPKKATRPTREKRNNFAKTPTAGQITIDRENGRTPHSAGGHGNGVAPLDLSLHPAVVGALHLLPVDGRIWRANERARFQKLFLAAVEAAYPTTEETEGAQV